MDQTTQYLMHGSMAPVAIAGARFMPAYPAPRAASIPLGVVSTLDITLASATPLAARGRAQPSLRLALGADLALRDALLACLGPCSEASYLEVPGAGRWWRVEGAPLRMAGWRDGTLLLEIDMAMLANYLPASALATTLHVALVLPAQRAALLEALASLPAAKFRVRGPER
jgi:hypothetical protein